MSGRGSGRRAAPCVAALCALLASPAFGQAPASPPPPTDPAELDPSAPLAPLPDLEVGWVIRKSRWGLGFATEAAREAIDVAFDHVGAEHVISVIRPDNIPSIRVAEKLGETKERSMMTDGVVSDIYGIFRPPGYRPRRSSYAGVTER